MSYLRSNHEYPSLNQIENSSTINNNNIHQQSTSNVTNNTFTTTSAGISGIIRGVDTRARKENKVLEESFRDLQSLMEKASEIVTLAERCSQFSTNSTQNITTSSAEQQTYADILSTMGIADPVTKSSAGTKYHQELAKEVATFVPKFLEKEGKKTDKMNGDLFIKYPLEFSATVQIVVVIS